LNLKEGDKILFFERGDGEVVINNASAKPLKERPGISASHRRRMFSGLLTKYDTGKTVRNENKTSHAPVTVTQPIPTGQGQDKRNIISAQFLNGVPRLKIL
jgi:bifunctional DNA-binding transcriptional regulator/antitoxin component of YhaV-PrlF toxin-antitoxin module